MLVGYEANNAMRNDGELGDYSREIISRLAAKYIGQYRAMLFSTRIRAEYRKYYSGDSNVSTFVPVGMASKLPSAWYRYRLNPWLQGEKVKIFHGLNEELPYAIADNIATVVTCYTPGRHMCNSLLDTLFWRRRMKYSLDRADAIVAVSDEVKKHLVESGVAEDKIVVIGNSSNPLEINEQVVDQYFELYQSLL